MSKNTLGNSALAAEAIRLHPSLGMILTQHPSEAVIINSPLSCAAVLPTPTGGPPCGGKLPGSDQYRGVIGESVHAPRHRNSPYVKQSNGLYTMNLLASLDNTTVQTKYPWNLS